MREILKLTRGFWKVVIGCTQKINCFFKEINGVPVALLSSKLPKHYIKHDKGLQIP